MHLHAGAAGNLRKYRFAGPPRAVRRDHAASCATAESTRLAVFRRHTTSRGKYEFALTTCLRDVIHWLPNRHTIKMRAAGTSRLRNECSTHVRHCSVIVAPSLLFSTMNSP